MNGRIVKSSPTLPTFVTFDRHFAAVFSTTRSSAIRPQTESPSQSSCGRRSAARRRDSSFPRRIPPPVSVKAEECTWVASKESSPDTENDRRRFITSKLILITLERPASSGRAQARNRAMASRAAVPAARPRCRGLRFPAPKKAHRFIDNRVHVFRMQLRLRRPDGAQELRDDGIEARDPLAQKRGDASPNSFFHAAKIPSLPGRCAPSVANGAEVERVADLVRDLPSGPGEAR